MKKIVLWIFILLMPGLIEAQRDWSKWLPVLADVESSNDSLAISYLGKSSGRGKYQISEICLKFFKEANPKWSFLIPEMLFNDSINEMICIWALNWLADFWGETNLFLIFSSYNTGWFSTKSNGVNWKHVNKIFTNKLCPEGYRIVK